MHLAAAAAAVIAVALASNAVASIATLLGAREYLPIVGTAPIPLGLFVVGSSLTAGAFATYGAGLALDLDE